MYPLRMRAADPGPASSGRFPVVGQHPGIGPGPGVDPGVERDVLPGLSPDAAPGTVPGPARRRAARPLVLAGVVLAGLACLVTAVVAGGKARAEQTRPPTTAERSAAAAEAVADRWRAWPAGRIFPATLRYRTTLRSTERAGRAGISPGQACGPALDTALAALARRDRCRAALRASYADELQGVVYTTGVLAFPDPARAAAFARALRRGHHPVPGLRAFRLPGTASGRFTDAARQAGTVRQAGPYVVLTVAGYADGRPAAATGQHRASDFAPAGQLARRILTRLTRPAVVNCARPEWAC